jgi:hypothetical protein
MHSAAKRHSGFLIVGLHSPDFDAEWATDSAAGHAIRL